VDLVIVGLGGAGLSAVLATLEEAISLGIPELSVAVIERAPRHDRGGNTRWSTAGIHPDSTTEGFRLSFVGRTEDADEYVRVLSERGADTLKWLGNYGLEFLPGPRTFMTSETPDLQPVGGGGGIIEALSAHLDAAEKGRFHGPDGSRSVGVTALYETTATDLVLDESGRVEGIDISGPDGQSHRICAGAVILACGGFEGNSEMLIQHVGYAVVPTSRGGTYNQGEGIRMAMEAGAKASGQWNEFHPLPADPRTRRDGVGLLTFAAVMETVPYGIVVNRSGARFMDEGAHAMNELYDHLARSVQAQEGQIAYVVFDSQTLAIPGYAEAVAKDKLEEPYEAATVEELASLIDVPAPALTKTVTDFNAAVMDGTFDPWAADDCRTHDSLVPPKSHWARRISEGPYYAYPVTCSIVFTFGGIGTNERAEVVTAEDVVIPGLYAAGEITGLYHRDYVGTTAVLRSLVFGRVAGEGAVRYLNDRLHTAV
jgi:tricarballylate dehydrogenase